MGFFGRVKGWLWPDLSGMPRPDAEPLGGRPARAVVLATEGTYGEEFAGWRSSYHATWTRKKLDVQLVGDAQQRAKVTTWLSEHEFHVTRVGSEVPVRVHERTGVILGLDVDAWAAEAAKLPRRPSGGGAGGPLVTS